MRRSSAVLLALSLAAAVVLAMLTTSSFFVARGSDAGVAIHSASILSKTLTLIGVAGAWSASLLLPGARSWLRWTLRVAGFVALGLSTHLVVFNNRRGVLEEHWFHVRFDRAAYDRAEGLQKQWSIRRVTFGVELIDRNGRERRFVFTGVAPWSLDLEPTLRLHHLDDGVSLAPPRRPPPAELPAHPPERASVQTARG